MPVKEGFLEEVMSDDLEQDRRLPATEEKHSRQKEQQDTGAHGLVQATPP